MRKFIISTDTTCDLPKEFVLENDLDIHTLYYAFGDEVYGDEKNLSEQEFYQKMRNGAMPTTMACNPVKVQELFEKRIKEGYDILHLAFSSALSSSYNTTCMVANELKEEYPDSNILVIDTLAASMGEGLVVYKAVQLKKQGKSMEEIADYITGHLQNFCHFFTVDDLNHLYRGGRVSRASAIIGTIAGIKPMLHVSEEGKLIPIAKIRTRKKSLIALVDKMDELMGDYQKENDIVFISHGDCEEDARFVAGLIEERFHIPALINYICPTIGTHSGPGTVALFFMGTARK